MGSVGSGIIYAVFNYRGNHARGSYNFSYLQVEPNTSLQLFYS